MIHLPAHSSHDLNWAAQIQEMQQLDSFLIYFDFRFATSPFFINDTALFQTFILTLEHFSKTVFPSIQDKCQGILLFKGSIDILSKLVPSEEDLSPIESATLFASYLHRLAAFLPDEVPVYCLFDSCAPFSKGEVAQLLSPERFLHLHLSLTPSESPMGVLLPPDELCSPDILSTLTKILESDPAIRIIPEAKLNECWQGLDELIVFEEAVSKQGKRQLMGFEAAGGKIRSRGIRTPDPLLPKQLR